MLQVLVRHRPTKSAQNTVGAPPLATDFTATLSPIASLAIGRATLIVLTTVPVPVVVVVVVTSFELTTRCLRAFSFAAATRDLPVPCSLAGAELDAERLVAGASGRDDG